MLFPRFIYHMFYVVYVTYLLTLPRNCDVLRVVIFSWGVITCILGFLVSEENAATTVTSTLKVGGNISLRNVGIPISPHSAPVYTKLTWIFFKPAKFEQSCPCGKLIKHHAKKTYEGTGCIDPRILDRGNTCKIDVVNMMVTKGPSSRAYFYW
jgi:hypothetical protein